MAFNFKQAAEQAVILCPIMEGRTKMTTEEVINQDLTVVGFDFAPKYDQMGNVITDDNGETDEYGVIIFDEFPDKYYSAGTIFTKICKTWVAGFDGNAAAASEELKNSGGVRVRFFMGKTKKSQNLVNVQIL